MRVAVKVDGAPVRLYPPENFGLNSVLSEHVSTADFDIDGEDVQDTPLLAVMPATIAYGGNTHPYSLQEVKIDRGPVPFESCALSPMPALGGASTYIDHFFGGYIASVDILVSGLRKIYRCSADGYNGVLRRILVDKSYTSKTEAEIITALFTAYWPEIDTSTYVTGPETVASIQFVRIFLNEALQNLASLFGREWYIDHELKLHYFTPTTTEAPFILSDTPALSHYIGYSNLDYKEDASELCNRITVVGRDDLGVDIVVVRTDAASYAYYGRYYDDKYVDTDINTQAWAEAVGDAILTSRAWPKVYGSLTCEQEGLVIGQKVRIINRARAIDDFYLIQSLNLHMIGGQVPGVRITYGDYHPDLISLLSKIKRNSQKEA